MSESAPKLEVSELRQFKPYQDTKKCVEWLGDIPDHREMRRLNVVVTSKLVSVEIKRPRERCEAAAGAETCTEGGLQSYQIPEWEAPRDCRGLQS